MSSEDAKDETSPGVEVARDKRGRRRPTGRPKGAKQAEKRLTIKKVNKILGMHLRGASNKEIVEVTDSSPNSVVKLLQTFREAFKNIEHLGAYRSVRNDLLDATELMALKSLNDSSKLEGATWRDVAVGFEKIVKANRLYHGQSSENVSQTLHFFDKSKPDSES